VAQLAAAQHRLVARTFGQSVRPNAMMN